MGARQEKDGYYGMYLQGGNEARIAVTSNGSSVKTYAPACDVPDSILTTLQKSGNRESGFVKLGNGLILQWGYVHMSFNNANSDHWFNFPTPFAIDCMTVVGQTYGNNVGSGYTNTVTIRSFSTTNFSLSKNFNENRIFLFFAIGY